MPLPRYHDEKGRFDIQLLCKCGYAVEKCRWTQYWKECPLCGGSLRTARVDADPPHKVTYASSIS